PCAAGDFNGDGFSDIAIADPSYNGGLGGVFVFFGTARANGTTNVLQLSDALAQPTNDGLGSSVIMGDFNQDSFADVAAVTGKMTNYTVYYWFGSAAADAPSPAPQLAAK